MALTTTGCSLAIQLVAHPGADTELLRVAAAVEAARPWVGWRPDENYRVT